jgi:hypothetical protein
MWIQVILLAVAIVVLFVFIRNSHTVRAQALKRIAFIMFLVMACYAVLRPGDTNWVANKLGVGRGADLVLYLLVAAFAFFALNTFLRFRNLDRRFTDLVRAVAISDASSPEARALVARELAARGVGVTGLGAQAGPPSDGTGAIDEDVVAAAGASVPSQARSAR